MKKILLFIIAVFFYFNARSQSDNLVEKSFSGPINSVFEASKVVWIYPTNEKDFEVITDLKKYITEMYNKFRKNGSILISDSTALTMNLSDYAIIAYGTIESNLFLNSIKSKFPFKIEDNKIYADKVYSDERIKFITCLPNPQNLKLGMVIYTGISNKFLTDINSVFHGPTDFIMSISLNKDNLNKGFYNKTGEKWVFIK